LHQEEGTISYSEYRQLLIGINSDTPLGYTVQVRSETDHKKIKEMSRHEKEIRARWAAFKGGQGGQQKIENVQGWLKSMFGGGAKA
jgi:pyruvate/2-oxoglutarate dehydrogenase complex dihydrolipoamide acyltransferase (E2) component